MIITEEKLNNLLNKAFEAGCGGYKDLQKSTVDTLLKSVIKQPKPKRTYSYDKKPPDPDNPYYLRLGETGSSSSYYRRRSTVKPPLANFPLENPPMENPPMSSHNLSALIQDLDSEFDATEAVQSNEQI